MNDQDVRDMLRRRAGDVTPGGDAWDRIVERIGGDEVAPVTELQRRRHRRWSPVTGLGAAAAAVVLVVAMAALLRGGDEGRTVEVAGRPSTSTVPATMASAPSFEVAAEQAARAWVEAVGGADFDRAWDLLADQSREAIGGRAGFEASRSELTEGWGAWAGVPDASYRVVSLSDPASDPPAELPRLAVVTLTGMVEQEGTTAFRAVSMAVRGTVEEPRVDLFANAGIELHPGDPDESGSAPIPGRTKLGAYTPSGAKVWFLLDDRAPAGPDDVEGADGDQQLASYTPAPTLTSGRHVLTVAALMVNDRILTRSVVYAVSADAPQAVLKCGMVGFTPYSEDAASDITVTTGTSCAAARAFVTVAGKQTSSGGPDEVVVDGYRCVRTDAAEDPLPRSNYRCTKGTTVITFVRT